MTFLSGQNLAKALGKLIAQVNSHIGAKEDAHMVATTGENGFMSAEDKRAIVKHLKGATVVADGTDLLSLQAGVYTARNFKNGNYPSGNMYTIVEITTGGNSAKTIVEYCPLISRVFYRYFYGSDTDSGWIGQFQNWESIALSGDFNVAGSYCAAQYEQIGAKKIVEVRFDLNNSVRLPGGTITTLDSKYRTKTDTLNLKQIYFYASGFDESNNIYPVSMRLNSSGTLSIERTFNSSADLKRIVGHVTYFA